MRFHLRIIHPYQQSDAVRVVDCSSKAHECQRINRLDWPVFISLVPLNPFRCSSPSRSLIEIFCLTIMVTLRSLLRFLPFLSSEDPQKRQLDGDASDSTLEGTRTSVYYTLPSELAGRFIVETMEERR